MKRKEDKSEEKISGDKKALGIRYLEEAKRKKKNIIKVQSEKNDSRCEDSELLQKKSHTNYLIEKRKQDYERIRRQRLEKLIHSSEKSSDKIKLLQAETTKLA